MTQKGKTYLRKFGKKYSIHSHQIINVLSNPKEKESQASGKCKWKTNKERDNLHQFICILFQNM